MRTFEELQRLWLDTPPLPRSTGSVRLLCLRKGGGEHACPERVTFIEGRGIDGDRWSAATTPNPQTQVTLMMARAAELVAADFAPLHLAGDNLLVDLDLSEEALPIGIRLLVGDSVVLEVSPKPHTGCNKFRDRFGEDALRWVNTDENKRLRLRGVNCRVIQGGEVALHDPIQVLRGLSYA